MPESYHSDYSEHSDEQLDELLCEYVDGTMDPAVRKAFEEYLEANPELAKHVRCLCETRIMLCSYACRHPGEESVRGQVRRQVTRELVRKERSEAVMVERLGRAAMLTSSVSLMVILIMVASISVANRAEESDFSLAQDEKLDHSMELPTDAYGQHSRALPLEWNADLVHWSLIGPSRVLPEIDMVPIGWHKAQLDSLKRPGFQLLATP